jgi:ribose 5-phosphate isomerase B
MPETIAIASDHAGFDLKQALVEEIAGLGFTALDLGAHSRDSVDYPDFADAMAAALADGRARRGLLICGTGIGIGIAANRHRHVRAATCHDVTSATLARRHNNANVLALGARLIGVEVARDCLATFLATAYEGGRHDRRVAKMS